MNRRVLAGKQNVVSPLIYKYLCNMETPETLLRDEALSAVNSQNVRLIGGQEM